MKKRKKGSKKVIIGKILLAIVVVLVVAVVLVTGVVMPKHYSSAYKKDYYNEFDDIRKKVVSFGLVAPSSHNIQSWKVVLDEEDDLRMEVYLNSERILPYVDENCNQMIISVGAFISYMEEGASKLGYSMDVDYFPEGVLPESPTTEEIKQTQVATITLSKTHNEQSSIDSLGGATKRLPYQNVELPNETITNLIGLNENGDIDFNIISSQEDLNELKEILISGVKVESENEMAMKETAEVMRYTTYQKNKHPFGLSLHSDNPSVLKRTITEFMATIFKQPWEKDGEFWYARDSKNIEQTNYFGILLSTENTRIDQINTGLLYGKISIYAQINGLEIQPIYQVLQDYSEMTDLNRRMNDTFNSNNQQIQMIFRLGEVDTEVPNGIRFTVEDIVETRQ